ncbi:MAG TPA: hypothetical protein VFW98_08420 [Gemmatimonadaceae bacterium]|nr:hypothetical protein [Gemmatimonadaceae bacterium]
MATTHETREAWLTALAHAMAPMFASLDHPLPKKLRVAAGWPSSGGLSKKGGSRTIGECCHAAMSRDGSVEIFISPMLAEPMRVADVLAHELAHAALGHGVGHRAPFARLAGKLGLVGPATATEAGPEFLAWARPLVEALGPYPHAAIVPMMRETKQTTRMIKCECHGCGYVCRTTQKWIDAVGAPHCPEHGEMEVAA